MTADTLPLRGRSQALPPVNGSQRTCPQAHMHAKRCHGQKSYASAF